MNSQVADRMEFVLRLSALTSSQDGLKRALVCQRASNQRFSGNASALTTEIIKEEITNRAPLWDISR